MTRLRGRNRRRGPGVDRTRLALAAWWGARLLAPALLLLVAWPALRARVRDHHYFQLREVVVERRGHVSEEAVRRQSGLVPGTSIWDVDPVAVEARLRELPWVRAAQVRRVLPDRVVIRIREYRPVAIVRVQDATPPLYYVAAGGQIFAPVEATDGRDLPYVSGLTRADVETPQGHGPDALAQALAVLAAVGAEPRPIGRISEVVVARDGGVTLVPARPAVPIELGRGDYETKLARVAEVLPQWSAREAEIRSLSCVFKDQVIVRLRHAAGGVGA